MKKKSNEISIIIKAFLLSSPWRDTFSLILVSRVDFDAHDSRHESNGHESWKQPSRGNLPRKKRARPIARVCMSVCFAIQHQIHWLSSWLGWLFMPFKMGNLVCEKCRLVFSCIHLGIFAFFLSSFYVLPTAAWMLHCWRCVILFSGIHTSFVLSRW